MTHAFLFFAGFLNQELLLFIWDQYLIGLDVAGYHSHLLSAFTATLLILLRDKIFQCNSVSQLSYNDWPTRT